MILFEKYHLVTEKELRNKRSRKQREHRDLCTMNHPLPPSHATATFKAYKYSPLLETADTQLNTSARQPSFNKMQREYKDGRRDRSIFTKQHLKHTSRAATQGSLQSSLIANHGERIFTSNHGHFRSHGSANKRKMPHFDFEISNSFHCNEIGWKQNEENANTNRTRFSSLIFSNQRLVLSANKVSEEAQQKIASRETEDNFSPNVDTYEHRSSMYHVRSRFRRTQSEGEQETKSADKQIETNDDECSGSSSETSHQHTACNSGVMLGASDNDVSDEESSTSSSGEEELRTHDEATRAALEVIFPPYTCSFHGISRPASPEEKHAERYFSLLSNSIDDSMISAKPNEWTENSLSMIKSCLKLGWPNTMEQLLKEINILYLKSIKKAVLDYILLDKAEQSRLGLVMLRKPKQATGRWRYPWYEFLKRARGQIRNQLFINHPVNLKILQNWKVKYDDFRLVNIDKLYSKMPFTIEEFVKEFQISCNNAAEHLRIVWLQECADIVQDNKPEVESAASNYDQGNRMIGMDHFFGCLSTLMSNIIRELVRSSIHDVIRLFEHYRQVNYIGLTSLTSMRI
ncbi:uncharacterized protein LOC113475134 [Ciona intestinalis]